MTYEPALFLNKDQHMSLKKPRQKLNNAHNQNTMVLWPR